MDAVGVHKLTVPVWNVLVSDTGGNIEHDDTALSVDVVSIAKTTELLLAGGIPDIELDVTQVLYSIRPCSCHEKILPKLANVYVR
jgi:hypothetical protein